MTYDQVFKIFYQFGKLKQIKLHIPGFDLYRTAVIEYFTKEDALTAINKLSGGSLTHQILNHCQ